jgi:hypothetical protein
LSLADGHACPTGMASRSRRGWDMTVRRSCATRRADSSSTASLAFRPLALPTGRTHQAAIRATRAGESRSDGAADDRGPRRRPGPLPGEPGPVEDEPPAFPEVVETRGGSRRRYTSRRSDARCRADWWLIGGVRLAPPHYARELGMKWATRRDVALLGKMPPRYLKNTSVILWRRARRRRSSAHFTTMRAVSDLLLARRWQPDRAGTRAAAEAIMRRLPTVQIEGCGRLRPPRRRRRLPRGEDCPPLTKYHRARHRGPQTRLLRVRLVDADRVVGFRSGGSHDHQQRRAGELLPAWAVRSRTPARQSRRERPVPGHGLAARQAMNGVPADPHATRRIPTPTAHALASSVVPARELAERAGH